MSGEWQVCAVCGWPLEELGGEWLHARDLAGGSDHVVVPVDMSEIDYNQRCDFCDGGPVTHFVMCETFEMPMPGPPQVSHGPWAACEACQQLFQRHSLGSLVTRVMNVRRDVHKSRRTVLGLYEAVKRNSREVISFEDWVSRGRPNSQAPD